MTPSKGQPAKVAADAPKKAKRVPLTPEQKKVKLGELAKKRVGATLRQVRLVGHLGKYSPTEQQVDAIMNAIASALKDTHAQLRGASVGAAAFSLPQ